MPRIAGPILALCLLPLFRADDASVRNEIQATYDRALRAQRTAKSAEDLDANQRMIDTSDWVSIVNDGPPQGWAEVRKNAIATLSHPEELAIKIVKFTLVGDRAIVIARVGPPQDVAADNRDRTVLIRDTWIKTSAGWRRKLHEKLARGKLEAELK